MSLLLGKELGSDVLVPDAALSFTKQGSVCLGACSLYECLEATHFIAQFLKPLFPASIHTLLYLLLTVFFTCVDLFFFFPAFTAYFYAV